MRIERYDEGAVLYLALDTSGDWARSEFPDELITFDFNSKGELIGVAAQGQQLAGNQGEQRGSRRP